MKEKEDPEFPLHLGADQQTPPGSVLLVIPINELPELGKGEKKQLYLSCGQSHAKQEDGLVGIHLE